MVQSEVNLGDVWARLQGSVRFSLELILVIALALTVAQLGWLIAAPNDRVAMQIDRPLPSPIMQDGQSVSGDRTTLVESNPFISAEPVEIVEAPETQLNLKLVGLLMSTTENGGSAQITTPDNRTQRFVPGEEILEGVTLERILSDRVILRRNGASEVLMRFGRTSGLSVVSDASQTVPENQADSTRAAEPVEGTVSDPEILFRTVRLTPVQRAGDTVGYRMTLTGSEATLSRAGLRDGDILQRVNGTAVVDIDFSELIDEMGAGQTANLQIERDGSPQTVRLRFTE